MSLSDIVNVQITKQTSAPSRVGFGLPLILTYHTRDSARVLEFQEASDMLSANGGPFEATDLAYLLALKAFSQNPKPASVLIGRTVQAPLRTVKFVPRSGTINGESYPLPSADYAIKVNGETFTFATDDTPTVQEIVEGLTALINAGSENVLATEDDLSLTIASAATPGGIATAGVPFTVEYDRKLFVSEDLTADRGLANELAAIQNINDDWYGLVGDWFGKAEISAVAASIEALRKIHSCVSADDEMYDAAITDDVGSALQDAAYARTFIYHHKWPHEGIAAAVLGKNLPKDPGSITWKFKTLAGITAMEYTPTEASALANKNVERYITVAGQNITADGKTSSGEFIDITRFVDFIAARLEENVFFQLKNADKIPYTDSGVAIIENEVLGVMKLGISVGGFAADPAPTVTVPKVADVPVTDRANRLLPDVRFRATLAGAIHELEIRGIVTV